MVCRTVESDSPQTIGCLAVVADGMRGCQWTVPLNLAGVQSEDVAEVLGRFSPLSLPLCVPPATEECLFVCVFVYRFDCNYL